MIAAGQAGLSAAAVDRSLLELAASGDAEAFDALIRPRLDRLWRLAASITQNASDAQDAVQEACVLAWRELPRLRQPEAFDAWLARIVVNSCRGLLRRSRRVQIREIDVDTAFGDPDAEGPSVEPDDVRLGESEALQRGFRQLDADKRTLLVMHYVEERPLAEIAYITGAPVGTVKWRLSNARQALDRALKEQSR